MKSEALHLNEFATSSELVDRLSTAIADDLTHAIAEHGNATLMVSGGSTPVTLFQKLSSLDIEWNKVRIGLCDERWIPTDHDDSNEKLVHTHLLKNHAAKAKFTGMYIDGENVVTAQQLCSEKLGTALAPFDVIVLGMGSDAHTASLFPDNPALKTALDLKNIALCIAVQPQSAPYDRMSLTLSAILSAGSIYLHIEGSEKRKVLETALSEADVYKMPIRAVLNHPENLSVYYAKAKA